MPGIEPVVELVIEPVTALVRFPDPQEIAIGIDVVLVAAAEEAEPKRIQGMDEDNADAGQPLRRLRPVVEQRALDRRAEKALDAM